MSLIPRNGLIILCKLLFRLINTFFNFFHFTIIGLLRFLSFIVLFNWLNCISSSNSSIFMQISPLRIIWKSIINLFASILFYILFSFFGVKIICSHWPGFNPFLWLFLVWRCAIKIIFCWVMENLLIFYLVFGLPFFSFLSPNGNSFSACNLNSPYFICRQVLKLFQYPLLYCNSILINLLSYQS